MWQRQQFFKIAVSAKQPIRTLMSQEHNGMSVLQDNGVRVPPCGEAKAPPQPVPGSSWWKRPVYYNPVVSPLERGPDFSFLDGRRPAITTKWELERRQKHVQLGKKIVMYLSELREAEQLYAERETQKKLMQERIAQYQLKPKGNEEIY